MIQDFIIPFVFILLAELGDKTQLAVLTLSTKTTKQKELFLGVLLAFAVVDGIAVLFGRAITTLLPMFYIKIGAGALFIAVGIYFALKKESTEKVELKSPFISGFSLIFLAELGDKTQIATALFATQYHPVLVFAGAMLALGLISAAALLLGKALLNKVDAEKMKIATAALFVLVGLSILVQAIG